MHRLDSLSDSARLVKIINDAYNLGCTGIHLHREMIGYVYFADTGKERYVLKIYRPFNTQQALQSIEIIHYLRKHDYPAVPIIPTADNRMYITLTVPEGESIGVLYAHIQGTEPNLDTEITRIGQQTAELHNLMEKYPKPLVRRGKGFFVDRYIDILKQLHYPPDKVYRLADYGCELWSRIEKLPNGFCHGDLHSGNMLQTDKEYILFDFDIASDSYSIIDVSTLSDKSNFNRLTEPACAETMRMFERFYQGYSRVRSLSSLEIAAIFDFIPVRHYELIATITDCQGLDNLSLQFLDQQFDWLMQWRGRQKPL